MQINFLQSTLSETRDLLLICYFFDIILNFLIFGSLSVYISHLK